MTNRTRLERIGWWLILFVLSGGALAVVWSCLYVTGLWMYVPGLRQWKIDRLEVIQGGQVEVIVSSGEGGGNLSPLSPDGRWLLIGRSETEGVLLDLVNNSEYPVDVSKYYYGRWLESSLLILTNSAGEYALVKVPEWEITPLLKLPQAEIEGGRGVELLKQAKRVYLVENFPFTGYVFLAQNQENQFLVVPLELILTYAEEKVLAAELSQATIIPPGDYDARMELPRGVVDHGRYYSPDGTLYAWVENPTPVERTPYLEVRTTVGDTLVARVRKVGYGPVGLGWSADGSRFYFRMHTGGAAQVLTPESPIYSLEVPANPQPIPDSRITNPLIVAWLVVQENLG